MARRGDGELSPTKKWAAAAFFLVGTVFILLIVFGPLVWGDRFDGTILKVPGLGLMGVAVYCFIGVNLPAVDWSSLLARIVAALLAGGKDKGQHDG